ncbi:hypothetical protein DPSP01_008107 [Paraphaeosphaeria sporulosa]|uniref:EthD domain-containing protein n=1 Tax=Paraphaeosphaeria sporulosa TaxID=1460663 RepID=A0A177CPS5_9PLEO|nr:uncharacterized protein CC84DRAFT_1162754 [Paraphaeosphaeria sporulosa]OAG08938.1 hypothetical protein CC84DRAFT_1162754 [Paraphaeosphaeria sporulosa]
MPAHVSVLYPRKAKFNMDYYLATHMPLVTKHWTQHGLKKYTVTQYDDPESPYSVGCVLEFESLEEFKKAGAAPEAKEVFADIDNFSNEKPSIVAGEVKEAKSTS